MRTRSRWKIVAVLVVVVAIGGGAFLHFHQTKPVEQTHYTASKVARGDIAKVVMTTGQLRPLVSVEVSTQNSGLITEVRVDYNTVVKKGEVLARIDPSRYEQALNQAKANLRAAEASTELARVTVERQKSLFDRHLVAEQDYDQALAQLHETEAALLTQQAAVKSAEVDLGRCTITSPIDGIVIYKSAEVGKTVQASFSAPTLFVIAQDLLKMEIIAAISEVDVWSVKPGQAVTFTVEALPNRTFHGLVKQLRNPYTPSDKQANQPQTESNVPTTFDAVIEVDNPDLTLLPSLTATVSIEIERKTGVLKIPNSALRVQLPPAGPPGAPGGLIASASAKPAMPGAAGTATVYRLPKGDRSATPEPVTVQLGMTDGLMTEVASGLAENDTVVTSVSKPQMEFRTF